ncbi:MAG: ATP-binding protein [Gemmobacter sp.]|nr:ATP-binding protein [Gemmobacter sp.]
MTQTLFGNVAPLKNVAALLALIDRVENRVPGLPGMATFYGPSGRGKSTAATYASNQSGVCHIEVQPLWRAKQMLAGIAAEMGVAKPARTAAALFEQAAESMQRNQRPLLIDEADRLMRDDMIEVVRGLHEATGAPVILIGEEELPVKLMRWERVHGRMLDWVGVQPADLTDVAQLATIYAPTIEITEDLRLSLLISSRRSHRYVSNNLARLAEFALARGLSRVTVNDWRGQSFFSGEPPAPRREEVIDLSRQRQAARAARRA